jgi:transmembrane sensor
MPATLPPVDRETLSALQRGDEQSLERLFRGHYAALCEEAKARLDEPAAAPRAVERVFIRMWKERARFQTPAELEGFMHEALHEATALVQSRRAALHRFEAHESGSHARRSNNSHATHEAPSVDQSWAHIHDALHAAPEHSAAELRHEAAEHLASIAKPRSWVLPAVVGVAIIAIIATVAWWIERRSVDAGIVGMFNVADVRSLSSASGQIGVVTLDDGSKVTLGGESRLVLPPGFPNRVRAVKLEGTAKFEVPAGEEPFAVVAANTLIRTTGTTFDVRAYPAESTVTVRVREGGVTVKAPEGDARPVAAGQSLAVARGGAVSEPTTAAVESALGWIDGRLVINDRPLREVLQQMKRWYSYDIYSPDTTLLARPVSMSASIESPREAITSIEQNSGLEFGYVGKTMVFRVPDPKAKQSAKRR